MIVIANSNTIDLVAETEKEDILLNLMATNGISYGWSYAEPSHFLLEPDTSL